MAEGTATAEFERRAGKNQSLFREVNERVDEVNQGHALWLTLSDWVCECADETCTERIEMTGEEYSTVRESPIRFAVMPSEEHVVPEVERVVRKESRYWVVEKFGQAAAAAKKLDPRSRHRSVDT